MEEAGSGVDAAFLGARDTYDGAELDVDGVAADPIRQLLAWIDDATTAGVVEPTAMALSTVRPDGSPSVRTVLLRAVGEHGLEFFTNTSSAKARHVAANPAVALHFGWPELRRQVRVDGTATSLPAARSDEYFAGRPRGSQLGAWASPQSEVLVGRAELEALVRGVEARFAGVDAVPRPPHWGGYGVVAHRVEFWQGRPSRLHDRVRYRRPRPDEPTRGWVIERLAP